MSYYWGVVKDLDDSQKLELVTMLIESVKPIQTKTLIDIPLDEEFADMDKELYSPEEAYEMTMKDIKAIYEDVTTWRTPTNGITPMSSRATRSRWSMPATHKT